METMDNMKVAVVDITRCRAWSGINCGFCYQACPRRDSALIFDQMQPSVIKKNCNGCNKCVEACSVVNDHPAIELFPAWFDRRTVQMPAFFD